MVTRGVPLEVDSTDTLSTTTETSAEKPCQAVWPKITVVTPVLNSARYVE